MGQAKLYKPVFLPELNGARLFPGKCRGGGWSSRRKGQLQEASPCCMSSSQGQGRTGRHGQRAQGPHVDTHVKHTHTPKSTGYRESYTGT